MAKVTHIWARSSSFNIWVGLACPCFITPRQTLNNSHDPSAMRTAEILTTEWVQLTPFSFNPPGCLPFWHPFLIIPCNNDTPLRPSPPCLPSCLSHLLHPSCDHFLPPHLPSSCLIPHSHLNHPIRRFQHYLPAFVHNWCSNCQSWAGFHFDFVRADESSGPRRISPNAPLQSGGFNHEGQSWIRIWSLSRILEPLKSIVSMCCTWNSWQGGIRRAHPPPYSCSSQIWRGPFRFNLVTAWLSLISAEGL